MAFDPSTLLSRTGAGDAELRTPQNGLSLGQRRILTLLDAPQAFEEFAARQGIDAERLDRDLAKLVAGNLVAVNGETAAAQPTTVVLGGLRAPSSLLRLAFVPVLIVAGAIAYFVIVPLVTPKPPPAVALSSAAAPAVPAAAPETHVAAEPAVVPIVVPIQVPPASAPAAPPAPREAATPAPALAPATDPKAMHLPAREVIAEPKVLPGAVEPGHDEPGQPGAASETAKSARASPPAPMPSEPARLAAVAPPPPAATAPERTLPAAAPALATRDAATALPAAHPGGPTAPPAKAASSAASPANDAAKLAMAAPSSAEAHAPATPKLLPITRQDPEFPREAIVRGIQSGDVKARLAIDGAGKVTGVDIVDARPARVFDRAVRDALSHWTFPAGASGRSTEVEIAFHRD